MLYHIKTDYWRYGDVLDDACFDASGEEHASYSREYKVYLLKSKDVKSWHTV